MYNKIRDTLRLGLQIFFKRIEIVGVENIPHTGSVIFFGNHPNSLLDPAMLISFVPRKVAFAAKDTLFTSPFVATNGLVKRVSLAAKATFLGTKLISIAGSNSEFG